MRTIVVGAGIAGLSIAWALTRSNNFVTLLEQGPIPNPLSASGDQHRIIRRAYGAMRGYQRRIDDAYTAWETLWADLGADHLVETGCLILSQTGNDPGEGLLRGLEAEGYPLERFTSAAAAEAFPFLAVDRLHSIGLNPEGGVLLCRRIATDLTAWLRGSGADVRETCRVSGIDPATGAVTLASGEKLHADRVVVSAGAWAPGLLPALCRPLTAYRTAVAYLTPPSRLAGAWEQAPVMLDVGGDVDGYVLPPVRGTGLKVGAGPHKRRGLADDDRIPEAWEGPSLRDRFRVPFADIDSYGVDHVVTCAYTFTEDHHFHLAEQGKVLLISACSGHGYKFGAAVGLKVAEALIRDRIPDLRTWIEARD